MRPSMTSAASAATVERPWTLHVVHPGRETARVELTGDWRKDNRLPEPGEVWREIQAGSPVRRLTFDGSGITQWDSGLVTFAVRVLRESATRGIEGDRAGLPEGVQRLLRLAEAVPVKQTGRGRARPPWLARIGTRAITARTEAA